MTTPVKGLGLGALALLAAALPAVAAVYAPIADEELLRRSPVVVVAQSLGSHPGTATTRWPEIVTRFSVIERLKGSAPVEVDVAVPGGPLPNGLWLHVPDVPRFTAGGQYLLFLVPRADGAFGVSELSLGAFDVLQDLGGRKFVTREAFRGTSRPGAFVRTVDGTARTEPEPLRGLASFSSWVISGATASADYVRADVRDALVPVTGGVRPEWGDSWAPSGTAFRWNGTPSASVSVRNEVPGYGGQSGVAGAGGGLVYEFGNAVRWWSGNRSSTISYTRGADSSGAYDPLDLPGPGSVVVYANNISEFGTAVTDCTGSFTGLLALGGVLTDQGTHAYKGFTWTNVAGGIGWIREIQCSPGSVTSNDFENMMTAVVGNTLGLSNNPQPRHPADVVVGDEALAVMNKVFASRQPGLGSDDVDAVCFLYGTCNPLVPPTGPPTALFYFQNAPLKGASVLFSDLSTNSPTSWAWEFTATGATTITKPDRNPVVVFPNVGTWDAKLTATNSGGSGALSQAVHVFTDLKGALTSGGRVPVGSQAVLTAALSAGTAGTVTVNFGDGSTATQTNPGSSAVFTHTYAQAGRYSPFATFVDASALANATTAESTVTVATEQVVYPVPCSTPSAPVLSAPASVEAGTSILLTWAGVPGFTPALDRYVVELSDNPSFSGGRQQTYVANSAAVVIPPDNPVGNVAGDSIWARLHVTKVCATDLTSPNSNVVRIDLTAAAAYVTTTSAPGVIVYFITTPPTPAPTADVTFLNRPFATASASLTLTGGSFFSAAPSSFTLAPGASEKVTISFTPAALSAPGVYNGTLNATYGTTTLQIPISLVVVSSGAAPGPPPGPSVHVTLTSSKIGNPAVVYLSPTGTDPVPQTITLTTNPVPGSGDQWFLDQQAIPSWIGVQLACGGGENDALCAAGRFPASGKLNATLTVNRAKRPADNSFAPQRSDLVFAIDRAAYPDEARAVVTVLDVEPLEVTSNAGGDLSGGGGLVTKPSVTATAPSGGSFVVPTVVQGRGLFESMFSTEGWVKNVSSTDLPVTVYFIPEGADGTSDPGVLKVKTTAKAGQTLRMSNTLLSYFGLSTGNGRLEIRSTAPQALTVRMTTEGQEEANSENRFSTEDPIYAWGQGIGLGGTEIAMPGVAENADNRTNLVLTETTGQSATAEVTVRDAAGALVGTITGVAVPPFSKVQINRLVDMASPGTTLSLGSASVKVTAGTGKLVAISTVVDNRSQSISLMPGTVVSPNGAPSSVILPAVVRLVGAYNTNFSTSLYVANGTDVAATVRLTYTYVDQDEADLVRTVSRDLTLPARSSMPADLSLDVVPNFFGIAHRVYGYVRAEGDVGRVVISVANRTLVDSADPSKGYRSSQVAPVDLAGPDVQTVASEAFHFAGTAKSVQKRTNLILLNPSDKGVTARVSLSDAQGNVIASRPYNVAAGQYLQIFDLFGPQGMNLDGAQFLDYDVAAQVISGEGKLISFATVIDNLSRSPSVYILRAPGPPR